MLESWVLQFLDEFRYELGERRRQWHSTPVFLPGKSHGWRSLEGCSPWSRWGSDTTEGLHFHFSLSYTGEGNGNPLQYSCLENPRDGEAWWAAVYGVAQSRTRLKRLSSSSSRQAGDGRLLNWRVAESLWIPGFGAFKVKVRYDWEDSSSAWSPVTPLWAWSCDIPVSAGMGPLPFVRSRPNKVG